MLRPTPIKLSATFGAHVQFCVTLLVSQTLPNRKRDVGALPWRQIEQLREIGW